MVHGLASQLGGGLMIESQPGQGTTIELWLPLSDQLLAAATADKAKPAAAHHGAGRALVVDDEDLVRGSVADMLTELQYGVVEASSAEEALDLLANGPHFDVVITDHLMSEMSGAALACEVRKRWPLIRTVIMSGYAEAEGIGPDLLTLSKPFRQGELAEILAETARACRPTVVQPGARPTCLSCRPLWQRLTWAFAVLPVDALSVRGTRRTTP